MLGYVRRARSWFHGLLRAHLTPGAIGLGVGVGVFLGCLPLYGLHLLICIGAARVLKLNQAVVYAAANISNPFVAPVLIGGEIAVGEWLRKGTIAGMAAPLAESDVWTMARQAPDLFVSCVLGSVVLGTALGAVLGGLALVAARWWRPGEAVS